MKETMTDIIESAEAALEAVKLSGNDPIGSVGLIAALVGALKAARAENGRLNGVLDALENRIKIERLRSRDRAAVEGELARLRDDSLNYSGLDRSCDDYYGMGS